MKHFLAGFALCFLLACLAAWGYDRYENAPVQSTAWFAHDDQAAEMYADLNLLNERISATLNAIEKAYQGMTMDNQIVQQNQFLWDAQFGRDANNMIAYATYDVALVRKLHGHGRQELGYNLITAGFSLDNYVNATNLLNDNLIAVEQMGGGTVAGMKPLLVTLRQNMDEAHVIASRLKCEQHPQPPIHLVALNP